MRRSHHLKPDTFPFLAVLLCAMGSLIVILLVLDRQARLKAKTKAAAKQQEQLTERQRAYQRKVAEEKKRQEEILRQHQLQVQKLKDEREQVIQARRAREAQLRKLEQGLSQQATVLKDHKTTRRQLADQLRETKDKVKLAQAQVKGQKESVRQAMLNVEDQKKNRYALSQDLADLAVKLQKLREDKQKESETWSVVPYKGQQGENRQPLYVECTAQGLIFYPDRKVMQGFDLTALQIRREVLFRMSLMQVSSEEPTYWLLLVRPNGVMRYYQFLTAVRGLSIVYGYELVDQDWNLDFPLAAKLPRLDEAGKLKTLLGSPRGRGGSQGDRGEDGPDVFSAGRALAPLQNPALQPIPSMPGTGSATRNPGRPSEGRPLPFHQLPRVGSNGPNQGKGQPPKKTASDQNRQDGKSGEPKREGQPKQEGQSGSASRPKGNTAAGSRRRPLEPAPRYVPRDWEMVIECTSTAAILTHTGQTVDLQTLRREDGKQVLLQSCLRLIEDRRKFLRDKPEEFYPRIRFVVHTDGLRSYHLAYPALHTLQIPKTAVMKQR